MQRRALRRIALERPRASFALLGLDHRPDSVIFAHALTRAVDVLLAEVVPIEDDDAAAAPHAGDELDLIAIAGRTAHLLGDAHAARCRRRFGHAREAEDWLRTTAIITAHLYGPPPAVPAGVTPARALVDVLGARFGTSAGAVAARVTAALQREDRAVWEALTSARRTAEAPRSEGLLRRAVKIFGLS